MGTRSYIAAAFDPEVVGEENPGIIATYCHYDGYVSGVGATLKKFYNDDNGAFDVADYGYWSSLPGDGIFPEKDSLENSEFFSDEEELLEWLSVSDIEYVYLWKDSKWFYLRKKIGGGYVGGFEELTSKVILDELVIGRARAVNSGNEEWISQYDEEIAFFS